jgi:serine/threonine-protein kinase
VTAGGGEPKAVTKVEPGETVHMHPSILPGGRAVLFTIVGLTFAESQVAVLDLHTGQRKTLIRGASDARYVDTGHLVYASAGALLAVRFDLERLEVEGEPLSMLDQVSTSVNGEANVAIAGNGTLVYVPGDADRQRIEARRSLVWVTRQGREEPLNLPPRPYATARVSPDGARLALDIRDQASDVWIWEVTRQTLTALNPAVGTDMMPVWSPDGLWIFWASQRNGGNPNIYRQAADGTGAAERLTSSAVAQIPTSISPDGKTLALFSGQEVAVLPLVATSTDAAGLKSEPKLLFPNRGMMRLNGEISPDGRWIAYQSEESGPVQIYVRPFPNIDAGRWPISTGTRPM